MFVVTTPRALLIVLLALFACGAAWAQPRGFGARVEVSVVVQEGNLVPGAEAMVGVVLDMQRGWKVQAGKGSGDEVEPYIPTSIEVIVPHGWSAGTVMWPGAKRFTLGGEQLSGYEGKILAVVPVRVPASASPGQYAVQATVRYQACDANICERPTLAHAVGDVRVVRPGEAADGPQLDATLAGLFRDVLARSSGISGIPGTPGTSGTTLAPTNPMAQFQPGTTPIPAAQPVNPQESREQSWFISYWYLWVIALFGVIACGVVLWRVLR